MSYKILVDHSHCGRHVTGLERITLELFGKDSLAPLQLMPIEAASSYEMLMKQQAVLPLKAATNPKNLMICPGFPPPLGLLPFKARVVPYIHDMFLMTRAEELSRFAKLYMAPSFRQCVKNYPHFMVNSATTRDNLRGFCRKDAEIHLFRPPVRNVFGLDPAARQAAQNASERPKRLSLAAISTIEPRKNFMAAARLIEALNAAGMPAHLTIIGRSGWGGVAEELSKLPNITLAGYLPQDEVRATIYNADFFISTAHDEGLGLPLLEVQYAGLPVIASDIPVFREVLGTSGVLIDTSDPQQSAAKIFAFMQNPQWQEMARQQALDNVAQWLIEAERDKEKIIAFLSALANRLDKAS